MKRVVRNALIILLVLTVGAALWRGWGTALSVMIGGAVAVLNFKWMSAAVSRVLGAESPQSTASMAVKYVFRLLLILGALFAMIHVSFLSLLGGVAGLSIFVLSGMVEAILLTVEQFSTDK